VYHPPHHTKEADVNLNHPELTAQALGILRKGSTFQWYFVPLFAFVLYVYVIEIEKKNWKCVAAGLSLYGVHWAYEIANGLIQHFWGHALWIVPSGTSFLLLIGVGWELSMMFAVAGVILSKLLPADPKAKVLGVNNRVFFAIADAAFYSIIEIFLSKTPAFHWVYPWWGALPVFVTVYIPFFLVSNFSYDWPGKKQRRVIGTIFGCDAAAFVLFALLLGWI
jgi:hypothetical protein